MYLSFYNLRENPFQISTDPKFLWLGPKHEEGLATLKYGVLGKKGFLLLTGDVGTGKTTLVNALLNTLGEDILVAVIRDPNLEPLDFFNYIAHAFKMGREFDRKGSFLIHFEKFLVAAHAAGRTVLLIIDESQRITPELLEEVRLLSNIERHDCKLLNIFFVGQIEFNDILLRPENRAIRQRITVNYTIPALTESETGSYIEHRLEVAGLPEKKSAPQHDQEIETDENDKDAPEPPAPRKEIFTPGAVQEIFSFSRGYPRLINVICDRCLLTGFVEDAATITTEIVRECREELRIPESGLPLGKHALGQAQNKGPGVFPEREEKKSQQAVATDDTAHLPGSRQKQPGRFNIRLMLILAVLLIGIAFTYTDLSKNDDQSLLTNMLMKYAGEPGPSTTDPAPGEDEGKKSEPVRLTLPQAEKRGTVQASATEKINNGQDGSTLRELGGTSRTATAETNGSADYRTQPPAEKSIIYFPKDSINPADTSLAELNSLAESLLHHPRLNILITGYSDSLGHEQYNVKLSEFRANTVKSYLMGRGLAESRIRVQGLGSQDPIASNETTDGRNANRRVEIEIIESLDN